MCKMPIKYYLFLGKLRMGIILTQNSQYKRINVNIVKNIGIAVYFVYD